VAQLSLAGFVGISVPGNVARISRGTAHLQKAQKVGQEIQQISKPGNIEVSVKCRQDAEPVRKRTMERRALSEIYRLPACSSFPKQVGVAKPVMGHWRGARERFPPSWPFSRPA
jgi:hypothetical protein